MNALKDICKLGLVLAGISMAVYVAVEYWWLWLFLVGATVVLLTIKYVVDGRFRQ